MTDDPTVVSAGVTDVVQPIGKVMHKHRQA